MNSNGNIAAHLPVLDGKKNWDRWVKQMKVIFGFQDVLEIVSNGFEPLPENPTDVQRNTHREAKKKDCKALFYIHQCVDNKVFEKIADAESSKEAWDTLVKYFSGDDKVKKIKLQALRRQYELLQMKDEEKIEDYFSSVLTITNQMKLCGETLSDRSVMEKILRTLPSQFDHLVITYEETKDLNEVKIEELQGALEAHEMKITGRKVEKDEEQALLARFKQQESKKDLWKKRKGKNNQKQGDKPESSKNGAESSSKNQGKKDKRKVQCYCCEKYGHYASECWFNKDRKGKNKEQEANVAQEDSHYDVDTVMLMANTSDKESEPVSDTWYLDTGCSNHMTGKKEWLGEFDDSKKTSVRLADCRSMKAEGMGNVTIQGSDGKRAVIEEVLYVPGMKCNLMSVGQLIEKVIQ
jgi:hypothetical protein